MRKVCELGRSMVEMLGVLAIIGVLSVGGIAGYSKAMRTYKLNQHKVAINSLINNALQIKDRLETVDDKTVYYNELFYKMGILPDGIEYDSMSNYIHDNWFNIRARIYHNRDSGNNFGGISFFFEKKLNEASDVCRNIVLIAKENADSLWLLETSDKNEGTLNYKGHLYGNGYCGGDKKCLSTMTLTDTEELCSSCSEDGNCSFYVLWK